MRELEKKKMMKKGKENKARQGNEWGRGVQKRRKKEAQCPRRQGIHTFWT